MTGHDHVIHRAAGMSHEASRLLGRTHHMCDAHSYRDGALGRKRIQSHPCMLGKCTNIKRIKSGQMGEGLRKQNLGSKQYPGLWMPGITCQLYSLHL